MTLTLVGVPALPTLGFYGGSPLSSPTRSNMALFALSDRCGRSLVPRITVENKNPAG